MKKQQLTKMNRLFSAVLFAIVLFSSSLEAQVRRNVAPDVTNIAGSDVRTGVITDINNGNLGTCGTQLVWISTNNPPNPAPGTDWIEWEWADQKVIDGMTIHYANPNARILTGFTIQSWENNDWEDIDTITGLNITGGLCSVTVFFDPIPTSRMRITSFLMNGPGQTSNPNFREIEILESPCEGITAGIEEVDTVFVNSPVTIFNQTENVQFGVNSFWYVNDDLVSTERDLNYVFEDFGPAEIKLVVDGCEDLDSTTRIIEVVVPTEAPESEFVSNKNTVSLFEQINFRELSTGGATTWAWTIRNPDGSPADVTITQGDTASRNLTAFFNTPGSYEVCLTTTNAAGSNTICKEAYINVLAEYLMCLDVGLVSDTEGILHDDAGPGVGHGTNLSIPIGCPGGFGLDLCVAELRFELESFDLAPDAYLRIYEGVDNQGTPLWDERRFPNGLEGQLEDLAQTVFISNSGKMFFEFETQDNPSDEFLGFTGIWSSTEADTFDAPEAIIEGPDSACINSPVVFESVSTGLGVFNQWSVSNQSTTGARSVFNFRPENLGLQEVKLFVESCGGVDSATKSFVVNNPTAVANPDFEASTLRVLSDEEVVTLSPDVEGCYENLEWNITPTTYEFVGGTDSLSDNPQLVFTQPGCYDIKLIVNNSVGSNELTKECAVRFVNYCLPRVGDLNSDIGISSFSIGTDAVFNSVPGEEAYIDFVEDRGFEPIILERGATYPVEIARNTNLNNINRRLWVDFNADGEFASDELVVNQSSNNSLRHADSFTVPMDAELANTRMRLGVSFANQRNTPCGTNLIGQFADYPVEIVNDRTAPVIDFTMDGSIEINRCEQPTAAQLAATAFDNVDGDITSQISIQNLQSEYNEEGEFILTYTVSDQAGNTATEERTLIVLPDATAPDLVLLGDNPTYHEVLTVYQDSGALATDECSGVELLESNNQVDESALGLYEFTYTATDSSGNTSSITRQVFVVDSTAPEIEFADIAEGDTIYQEVFDNFEPFEIRFSDNFDDQVNVEFGGAFFNQFGRRGRADELGVFEAFAIGRDASRNETILQFFVKVEDREAPTIDLMGVSYIEIMRFATIPEDTLVDVQDNFDPNPSLMTSGSYFDRYLTGMESGTYEINYQAEDASGNRSNVRTRVVRVLRNTTGIDQVDQINEMSLYPNPANTFFNIDLALSETQNVTISLRNTLGQIVNVLHEGQLNSLNAQVDTEGLKAGMYFVEIIGADFDYREKIVIVN